MGIENRDYYRESSGRGERPSGFSDMPIACKRLLIANVVVFVLQMIIVRPATETDIPSLGPEFEYYFDEESFEGFHDPEMLDPNGNPETAPDPDVDDIPSEELRRRQIEYLRQMMPQPPKVSVLQKWGELDPAKVAEGQIWRLVTSAFLHDRYWIWHLLMNMLFLYLFGTRLEQMYGAREFTLFYFASAICASTVFLALHYYTGDMTPAIGASGAVWGVVALYAIHHPYETIRIYFLFPIQIRWLALLYLVLDLHPVLLALNGEGGRDGVAHAAHLGGALFGFLYFKYQIRLERFWNRLPGVGKEQTWQTRRVPGRARARSTIKMFDPEPQSRPAPQSRTVLQSRPIDPREKRLDVDLDRVLEKISSEGRESLTDDEVAVLEAASERYRDR